MGPDYVDDVQQMQQLATHGRGVWLTGWLVEQSGLTVEDVLAAKAVDPDAPLILYERATQFPPTLKLADACKYKPLTYISSNRRVRRGSRFVDWKRDSGFNIADPPT